MSQSHPNAGNPRDAARAAAAEVRAAAAARDRRGRTFAIAGLVLAVTILTVIVVLVLGSQPRSIAYDGEPGSVAIQDVAGPAGADDDGGIPVGPGLVAGSSSGPDATVVEVLFDYRCPYCADFEEANGPELTRLAQEGAITLVYRPVSFLDRAEGSREYSTRAATAAALVADRAPEHFVVFHEGLMANQPQAGEGPSDEDMARVAIDAGVPQAVVDQLTETTQGTERTFARWIHAATARGGEILGRLTTPAVLINGERWPGEDADDAVLYRPGPLTAAIEAVTS